ncbi:MAG: hypothetical protein WC451_05300 [Patescibacteria group bacterium]
MKKEKPRITLTKDDNIVVRYRGKRYELYFDKPHYTIFVGETGGGALVEIFAEGKIEYWPTW